MRSVDTLRVILDVNFDIDVKDPRNFRIADTLAHDKFVEALLKETEPAYEEYPACIEFINGECAGTYIVANSRGVFIVKEVEAKGGRYTEEKQISSLAVKKIEDLEFTGVNIDIGMKFVKITTVDGKVLTGSPSELAVLVQAEYGLKRPDEFKILLNQRHSVVNGYYAIGPWFDGEKLTIATESAYNPPWKKVDRYQLPPEIPEEKKINVLKRIIATVNSYRKPQTVTWILSYGLMANFAHYLRQKYGYFPHVTLTGRKQTGKTTLTALIQYLFWGKNPLPAIRPKSEAQLRQLLSQSTLVIPIEDWRELESDSNQVEDMISLLHSSSQNFVLRRITTSNKDVNGVYLSLSAVLADANYNKDVDVDTMDKVIFVTIDTDEGIDVKKAENSNALLKNELRSDYALHDVLHSIGIELLEIASEKLKTAKLVKDRSSFIDTIIKLGYQAWLEVFQRHGISLTATINGVQEFPPPELTPTDEEKEEDLELAFIRFIHMKKDEYARQTGNNTMDSESDLLRAGFYFMNDEIIVTYDLLKEFREWLKKIGFNNRGMNRLIRELGLTHTSLPTIPNHNLYKRKFPIITK